MGRLWDKNTYFYLKKRHSKRKMELNPRQKPAHKPAEFSSGQTGWRQQKRPLCCRHHRWNPTIDLWGEEIVSLCISDSFAQPHSQWKPLISDKTNLACKLRGRCWVKLWCKHAQRWLQATQLSEIHIVHPPLKYKVEGGVWIQITIQPGARRTAFFSFLLHSVEEHFTI